MGLIFAQAPAPDYAAAADLVRSEISDEFGTIAAILFAVVAGVFLMRWFFRLSKEAMR